RDCHVYIICLADASAAPQAFGAYRMEMALPLRSTAPCADVGIAAGMREVLAGRSAHRLRPAECPERGRRASVAHDRRRACPRVPGNRHAASEPESDACDPCAVALSPA